MRLGVFCGLSPGYGDAYVTSAIEMGKVLARSRIGLVCGGSGIGMMGALADSVLDAGGEVWGVIPEGLVSAEGAHPRVTTLDVVPDLSARKARMASLADGFVALPGGAGTLDEIVEMWTWAHLGLHAKPVGLLDVGGYYQPFMALVNHMVQEGFLNEASREALIIEAEPAALVERLLFKGV